MSKITIIIPCKNEEINIASLLESIVNQIGIDTKNIPIIICDAKSTDGTAKACIEYSDDLNITIIEGGLPSVGRNAGAKLAKTDYLLFIDADIVLDRHTLAATVAQCNGKYDMATVKICVPDQKLPNLIYGMNFFMQKLIKNISPFAVGAYMLVKTEAFWKLGGFDEDVTFAEDYFLSKNIAPKRFKLLNNVVYTSGRRFDKMGYWWMIKHFVLCFLNRNNLAFFKGDFSIYWK